jgi:vacuolar-type H+-ATPase subunit F/Vma7
LCNGDNFRTLRFEVFDWNRTGVHEIIGSVDLTLDTLIRTAPTNFPLINQQKKMKKGSKYENSGILQFDAVVYEKISSMLDYIRGGHQISLTVAIDFTASNGDPRTPNSLHYRSNQMNHYQRAISSIGNVLDYYDSDHLYPVYGFGAKLPPNWEVSHMFHLNFQQDPNVFGVNGILGAYEHSVSNVILHGPTNFAPVIRTAATAARSTAETNYHLLLIITDGVISDLDSTIAEIVMASDLPLSIVIVGVGDTDFSSMDILDADDRPLVHNGRKMSRDIVQFVAFGEFINCDPSALAAKVLAEIPHQFTTYMRMKGVQPRSAPVYGFDNVTMTPSAPMQ